MCLILFAWRTTPELDLLVCANRDEFHSRPARAARFWPNATDLLAGQDLQAGGTWLGVNRHGDFAAVTNFREPGITTGDRSRGELCTDFLNSNASASDWLNGLAGAAGEYGGFNILARRGDQLGWFSNQTNEAQLLAPGIYGVSNGLLDENWPKVTGGKAALAQSIHPEPDIDTLFELLGDRSQPDDGALPDTGVGAQAERLLAPRFIQSTEYGTRACTVVCLGATKTLFCERSFNSEARLIGQVSYRF